LKKKKHFYIQKNDNIIYNIFGIKVIYLLSLFTLSIIEDEILVLAFLLVSIQIKHLFSISILLLIKIKQHNLR